MAVRADLIANLAKNADNVGRVAKKAVNVDVTGKLAKNASTKGEVSASMIQQLAMSDNADDLAMLQAIVKDMPPERLDAILVKAFRDPASPKDAPTLTPQGQMIADVARGGDADPALTKTAAQGGGDTGIHEVDVGTASDLPPKAPPYAPKTEYKGKEISDDPKFHVKERIVNKDGQTQVRTPEFDETGKLVSPKGAGSASVDAQTAAAVKTAARGGKPKPIGDNAALKNSRPQAQNYSSAIARLAGLVDPRGVRDVPSPGFGPGMADKAVSGGVPGSSVKGAGPVRKRTASSIAADSVIDYDEITRLAKEAGIDISLASTDPEGFARALVAKADQGMFDATPLTGSQRAEMTGVAKSLSADQAQSGPVLREAFPKEAAGGTMAGRQGSVQQQAIEAITRKIQDNFNTESMPIYEGTASAAPAPYRPNAEGVPSQFDGYEPSSVGGTVDELPDVTKPVEPVGNMRDSGPAGDLAGSNAEIAAMRAADRAPTVKQVSASHGRQFTSRRVADIEAEMAGLSRNDPQYRELGLELRDAKLIDSYLEPHKRQLAHKSMHLGNEEAVQRMTGDWGNNASSSTPSQKQPPVVSASSGDDYVETAEEIANQAALKSKTSEDRIRQIDEALKNDTNKRTQIGTEKENIFSKYIPHALILSGAASGYGAYQSNKSNPDAVEDNSGLSRRERMRAQRHNGGQP